MPTELEARIKKLTNKVGELKATIQTIKPEKEFFFEKLRFIEVACQSFCSSDISTGDFIKKIETILFAENHSPENLADLMKPTTTQEDSEEVHAPSELDDLDDLYMQDLPKEELGPSFNQTEPIDISTPISLSSFQEDYRDEDLPFSL